MPVVVDASVVAKWYIPEQHYQQARELRDDYLGGHHELLAPSLLPFEVVNALKYSGHYANERLVEAAETLPEYGIDLYQFENCGQVATVASDLDCTLYDASYISLAEATDSRLYTADSRLLETVENGQYDAHHIRSYTR